MIALIDGDIVSYRTASSCNPTKTKPEQETLDVALRRAEDLMNRIIHETSSEAYMLFLGGSENFRTSIDPNYKANRKDMPKPMWLQDVRSYLVTEWNAEICDNIEADDKLGIEQTRLNGLSDKHSEYESVICSIDKDLHMIAGLHYNFVKQEWRFIDEDYAIKWFYQQLIQGDLTDNIMGFDGKARPKIPQFLQPKIDELWNCSTEREMWKLVYEMYYDSSEDKKESIARLHRNGKLLWIMRKENDYWESPEVRNININTAVI